MPDLLKNLDIRLFLFINNHFCSFCDFIFYWVSNKWVWIPFYFFLAIIIYKDSGKEFWKILFSIAVMILLTDQVSVFIKDQVMRYRPCHNLILQSQIHLVNGECGGPYGFVSSHSANSAGLTLFLILLFRKKLKWVTFVLIVWCFIISYSRIYLGTHYPADVAGGWISGILLSMIIFYFYKNFLSGEKLKS
jgi:undecaprenyl-diphosphatase